MTLEELTDQLKNLGKLVNLDMLGLTVNKLKTMINEKADKKHNHIADEVSTTNDKQFVNQAEMNQIHTIIRNGGGKKYLNDSGVYTEMHAFTDEYANKVSKLNIEGDGSLYLTDNGMYKPPLTDDQSRKIEKVLLNGDGTKCLSDNGSYKNLITILDDDKKTTKINTYSSSYIQEKINAESHSNRNILDDITLERFTQWEEKSKTVVTDGDGDKYLSDDGTYKFVNTADIIKDSVLNATDSTLSSLKINEVIDDKIATSEEKTTIELNKKQNAEVGKGLSTNDFTNSYRDKISAIETTGRSDKFLAQDGFYYQIHDYGINDAVVSDTATYSSTKIEDVLNTSISNLVLPTQNDAPTMWQKSYDNVKAGDVIEINTSVNYNIKKAMVQVFKYVAGQSGIERIISKFDESDARVYTHNPDKVVFNFGGTNSVKIKDKYELELTLNVDGFYETPLITKSDFVDLYDFTVEEAV